MKITLSNMGKAAAVAGTAALGFVIIVSGPPRPRPPATVDPCGPTTIRCVGGPSSEYATIQLGVNAAQAGDTVLVFDKASSAPYDEPVASVNAGSAGLPITIKAEFDCVSNNGATVVGGASTPACVSIREIATNDPYIIIQGFEITGQGMTHDTTRLVLIAAGSDNGQLLNNFIHDGSFQNECATISATNMVTRGNRISMCRPRSTIFATTYGTAAIPSWDIQAGVNDKISVSVQGGAAQDVTLTPTQINHTGTSQSVSATGLVMAADASFTNNQLVGSRVRLTSGANSGAVAVITGNTGSTDTLVMSGGWTGGVTPTGTPTYEVFTFRTMAQIGADVNAVLMVGTPSNWTGAAACFGQTCEQMFTISSGTDGLTSSIELLPVANDAYTTLGMTVGMGVFYSVNPGLSGTSTDWLVENNYFEHVSDCFAPGNSTRVVFRDNTCGENDEYSTFHIDLFQPGVASKVLLENVLALDGKNVQHHIQLSEGGGTHFIFRGMRTCRHRGAFSMATGGNDFYVYNNTFWKNAAYFKGTNGGQMYVRGAANTRSLGRNNIWNQSRDTTFGPEGVYVNDTGAADIDDDYDLWLSGAITMPSLASQAHDVNADPLVTDGDNCDFTLTALSPAIDAGGPLTTVAAADTGTGTTLVLTNARMFQDGWAGVTPDAIAVGTVGNVAQIVSINYATGEVTISASISRNDGDLVWWYADSRGNRVLYGPAPDIGAHERVK